MFWYFLASDFHETFTRSPLALNMSRKLVSDPKPAIHGKRKNDCQQSKIFGLSEKVIGEALGKED